MIFKKSARVGFSKRFPLHRTTVRKYYRFCLELSNTINLQQGVGLSGLLCFIRIKRDTIVIFYCYLYSYLNGIFVDWLTGQQSNSL